MPSSAGLYEPTRKQAYLLIHICVVLWGFTAILGKTITVDALVLVAWRLLLVLAVLLLLPQTWRGWVRMPTGDRKRAAIAGFLVALHWWTFYAAIKMANASVAVACMAVVPVFLSFLEPAFTRRPFQRGELLLAAVAVFGVWLVIGGTPPSMGPGIAVGLLSALLVSAFSALNKTLAKSANPYTLTAVEFGFGFALLLTAIAVMQPAVWLPAAEDWVWLAVLAYGCTLAPFVMAFIALRVLTAWESHLIVNLEPVYAVILAALLLGEGDDLQLLFYVGVAVLVATTALASRRKAA